MLRRRCRKVSDNQPWCDLRLLPTGAFLLDVSELSCGHPDHVGARNVPRFPLIGAQPREPSRVAHRATALLTRRSRRGRSRGETRVHGSSCRTSPVDRKPAREELANGVRHSRRRRRPSITVFAVAHHNPDTAKRTSHQRHFRRGVVADVDRQIVGQLLAGPTLTDPPSALPCPRLYPGEARRLCVGATQPCCVRVGAPSQSGCRRCRRQR